MGGEYTPCFTNTYKSTTIQGNEVKPTTYYAAEQEYVKYFSLTPQGRGHVNYNVVLFKHFFKT